MFYHRKELMFPVKVETPTPGFGRMLLEQFGGATGELTAALQYWVQSVHIEQPGIRDMLQDIAFEEFSHLEMVGKLIEQHTAKVDAEPAFASPLFQLRGIGPHLLDSEGQAWTAAYVNEGANVVRDLRADIAAEAGARQTYEGLVKAAPDEGSRRALGFLLTREIAHTQMFMKALDSLGKLTEPAFGTIPADDSVDLYFNLSKGDGGDWRGPWNTEPPFKYVAQPVPKGGLMERIVNPSDERAKPRGATVQPR